MCRVARYSGVSFGNGVCSVVCRVARCSGVSFGNGVCSVVCRVARYSGVSFDNGVCSQVEASGTSRSLVQGSHTECVRVHECDQTQQ